MPKRLANTFLIFALMVIAVLSWQWRDGNDATITTKDPFDMAQSETDYYLEDFKIVNVNNDNGQVYELSGNSLYHYLEQGNSTINNPVVQVYSEDNDYWVGKAQTGNLSADLSVLVLNGNVDLALNKQSQQAQVSVRSQSIIIDTVTREITSNEPVFISSDKWSFQANQMQANVDNGMLTLNSGVKAEYAVER